MARFLAIDWDHQQLHVVEATASGGAVRVQRAAVWKVERSPNPAEAEALGVMLREHLKQAGIAPAPVLACVGRDRVIVKDIRHPAVAPAEEAALVRLQALKELTDAADEVVIDSTNAGDNGADGTRRSLVLIARRELVTAYQTLCRSAGLKFLALTPRPFGIAACLKALAGTTVLTPAPQPADAAVGVLVVSENWAEFCVVRNDVPLYARSLSVGPALAGEVRRNVAVHAGQAPQHPVHALYVACGGEHAALRERLHGLLGIPVYSLDPFAGAERPELGGAQRGAFTGAVGLIHAQASRAGLPINFAHKKQIAKTSSSKSRYKVAVAAAAILILLMGGVVWAVSQLYAKDAEVNKLRDEFLALDGQYKLLGDDLKRYDAVNAWASSDINLLDELYDVTATFPEPRDVRLSQLTAEPQTSSAKDKDYIAKLILKGVTKYESSRQVDDFRSQLFLNSFYRVGPKQPEANRGADRRVFPEVFNIKVEVKKRPPDQYDRQLEVKKQPEPRKPGRRGQGAAGGGGGGGGEPVPQKPASATDVGEVDP